MDSFIYQIDKIEEENGIKLKIYSADSKNNTICIEKEENYQIFMKKDDFESLNIKSDNLFLSDKEFFNKNKDKVVSIETKSKELHKYLQQEAKDRSLDVFEADIPVEHRYIIENDVELYKKEKKTPNLKYLSIDIESVGDVEDQRIILLSTFSPQSNQVNLVYINKEFLPKDKEEEVLNHKFKDFKPVYVKDEKELLEKFKEDVIAFNPQIIVGWNVIDFDFKVIKERMKVHGIEFKLSKYEGETKMRIASSFFGKSNLSFPGILVFDAIQLLKTNFIVFEDYKLNTVAKKVLKDSKIDLEDEGDADLGISNKIAAIENMLAQDPIKLIEYNYKDSVLTSEILEKLNIFTLMYVRSILTTTPLVKVQSPIATLDIMYLKKLRERNLVAPSNFNFSTTNAIEGAFVLNPNKGYYNDVFVFDFKSLYPSIMMTFNIDPYTFTKSGQIEAPNGAKFDSETNGILPELIEFLSSSRDLAKKEKDLVKSHAFKITMNSFYGALASPKSRFYNKEIGEAITSFGREMMLETNNLMSKLGFLAIYNDTDSVFVSSKRDFKSLKEKENFGRDLEKKINEHFKKWADNKGSKSPKLFIELEKIFSKFFIATKKRYVGFDEITKKTMFTGLEAVRGDWTEVAKRFQVNLVNLIFEGGKEKEIKEYIFSEIDKLKKGEYDKDLIYSKKITKPLVEYTKTTPPHVKAARELEEFSGKLVKYVMLENGPKHISLIGDKVKYDYEHYIDKQLKGVADDLLESMNLDFDTIINSKKQKSLDAFF